MKFYTSVERKGKYIFEKGYKDGKSFQERVIYNPYLFYNGTAESPYKTIHGKSVVRVDFPDMSKASEYMAKYKDVGNHEIYGLSTFQYAYIYDNYSEDFEFDYSLLNIVNIDIENDSAGGFANIEKADKEITAITLAKKGKAITFGLFPFTEVDENNLYVQCENEFQLLKKFIRYWNTEEWMPDVLSSWNGELYDIPYVVNRINLILGEAETKKLSPFGIIEPKTLRQKNGKEANSYKIGGIPHLDYYVLYKKFAANERESYRLDYIADLELGEKKVDYSEYGSLDALYRKNPELFYRYNRLDAVLIEKLENKLHYIQQAVTLAYTQRVNFEDTLNTVRPWDVMIHNYLMDQKIVVPRFEMEETEEKIVGGYVKDPKPGLYKNVVSVDFTSLYPSLVMQFNISPDTLVKQFDFEFNIKDIFTDEIKGFTEELKTRNLTMTANGGLFRRDKRGFLPSIMKKYFDKRTETRKLEKKALEIYEQTKSKADESKYLQLKNTQTAFKLINNSGFGALANQYNRWFSNVLAEGITSSGQITIKFVEGKINEYLNKLFRTEGVSYVIYIDTDSAYICLDYYVNKLQLKEDQAVDAILGFTKKKLSPFIDSVCKDLANRLNAFEWKTSMKVEKICDSAFFIIKKRYALNVCWDEGIVHKPGKLKVTGLETVRSSVPLKARKALEDCYRLIFRNDPQELIEYVRKFRKEFEKLKFEEIAKPSSVNGLEKYYDPINLYIKGTPNHVKGALIYNEFLKSRNLTDTYELIVDHDKIKSCYLKNGNPTRETCISIKNTPPVELEIEKFIDYGLQHDKMFYQPLKSVCDAIGWEIEKTVNLEDLFT